MQKHGNPALKEDLLREAKSLLPLVFDAPHREKFLLLDEEKQNQIISSALEGQDIKTLISRGYFEA